MATSSSERMAAAQIATLDSGEIDADPSLRPDGGAHSFGINSSISAPQRRRRDARLIEAGAGLARGSRTLIADIQDVLGPESDKMARRYAARPASLLRPA
jgi:hypothetical protein